MDKILDKIIRQVIVESTTRKRLTKQIDSDTILNKLIKHVITEAAQKVVLSKLDNKVGAIVSNYGFGFKISANFPIKPDQVRTQIQGNSQFGTNSPYNSYLNYTYFVGSNMHKNPDKKFVANIVIINAKRMNSFNSVIFKNSVKYLLDPDWSGKPDVVFDGNATDIVGRKDANLEAQHHKARGPEAVYNSTETGDNYNRGSSIIFIDKTPGYANLPADLMTVLTKKGAALMSTSDSEETDDGESLASKNSEATTYFNSGVEKLERDDAAGAIKDFDAAIKLDPKYAAAYEYRGSAKIGFSSDTEAIKDFDEAIKLDPNNKDLYLNRANLKDNKTPGSGAEDMKTYDILNKGGKLPVVDNPVVDKKVNDKPVDDNPDPFEKERILGLAKDAFMNGEYKLTLNDYSGAIVDFNKAIELNPNGPLAKSSYYYRGNAKSELKDYEGAIADYDKAIEIATDNVSLQGHAYFGSGNAKRNLKNYTGALADYDKAIELAPDFKVYTNRGYTKADLKDYEGAIADYDKVINSMGDKKVLEPVLNAKGTAKNLLEPGSGDEDLKNGGAMGRSDRGEVKKQIFKYGDKDNSDLATLQEFLKTQLKASPNQTYIESVPSFKAFMQVPQAQFGTYGTRTSNMIADLKKAYEYTNTDGKTIEPDFIQKLIDDQKWKLKLTEQFKFTDKQKQLLSTKTVNVKPVEKEPVKKEPVKLKNLDQIPLGSNNWRSAQPTSTQLAKFIVEKGIKSVIRFNGNGGDTDNNFSIDDEKAVSTQNGAKFYKLSSTKDQDTVNSLLNSGNVLIHCHHGADRTGGNIGGWLYSKGWGDTKKIWNYTTQYNGWNRMAINSPSSFSKGGYLYQATKFGVKDINHAQELANGNKSIKKDATKKDDIKTGDTENVALTKAYQICLDAAKYLKKITTTNPHDYWSKYLRWDGASYRPNANKKGIAWFNSAWEKYYGTKLAAASKIRNTVTQRNINELNRRKNDVIEMIRKGGSMTVYLRIQNPSTGVPTDFKIKWDYFAGIQNAAVKGNPKKTVTKKPSSKIGGNLGR